MDDRNKRQFAKRFIELPKEKRALFLKGLEKEGLDFGLFPIVSDADVADRYSLSYAQQRMWFLWQLDPESAAYNLPITVRLNGPLDIVAFEKSINSLVERHETLRTCFVQEGDKQPVQYILDAVTIDIASEDLSGFAENAREEKAQQRAEEELLHPFDLTLCPLFRVCLLKLSDEEHILLLTLHHIISDGWSMNVMIEEFIHLYSAHSTGGSPELAPLPIQYSDYAIWQRSWLEAGELERQLDYWHQCLGNEQPVLELPTDYERPMSPSYVGSRYEFAVDSALFKRLQSVAQNNNVTVFVVLLAAFNILLYRYTGQSDLRVGVPVANRNRSETEGLIGCFINTQVLRTVLDDQVGVTELLQSIREVTLGAQAHQDLPFEKLVESLNLERSLSHSPLFQVMMNHQTNIADVKAIRIDSGLSFLQLKYDGKAAQFDLELDTIEKSDGLQAVLTYAVDLFDTSTIERMAGHWINILQSIAIDSTQSVQSIAMLDSQERKQVLHGWSRLDVPVVQAPVQDLPVYTRIATQTEQEPDAIALIYGEQSLNFGELNKRVDQLAWRLRDQGVKSGGLVGLAVGRTLDMVVSLLAILKTGAAYVPLDPGYPEDRLAYMMVDSGIQCLLSEAAFLDKLPVPEHVDVLMIEGGISTALNSTPFPPVIVHPENLAYIIYTSGSTGKPKGVAMSHRALSEHTNVAIDYFELTPKDRVLLFSSLNFDGFMEQLFPALCVGAGVVIRGDEVWDSETFYQEALRTGLTVADLSTAYWHMLVQDLAERAKHEQPDYGQLRQISATGEAMPPQGISAWQQAGLDNIRLFNTYGPTETTVTASHLDCAEYVSGEKPLPASMPIGRGLAGRAMYILDSRLEPTPVGVVGELFIGGPLLAEGYHNRSGLTSERFIADPFTDEPGARMYASGDLAYYRADGVIEYAGRTDFQVKIRGFRIELGEIESELHALPGLRDAVVLAQQGSHSQQLVAYLVPSNANVLEQDSEAQAIFISKIKAAIAEHLPEYMVPAQMALLAEMPLTPGGKVDRKALPEVDASLLQKNYEAPETELEQQLAEIWQDVLGIEQVGLSDNFFELGGHSLLLTQVISRVRQVLSIDLPLRTLFEASDLRGFVERVSQAEHNDVDAISPIARISRDQKIPLSYAQQRQWVMWQLEPESSAYHMTTALSLKGDLNKDALQRSFNWLVERHEVLRTRFIDTDGELYQVIDPYQGFELKVESLIDEPDSEEVLSYKLKVLGSEPFDLRKGSLLRVLLIQKSDKEHVLAMVQHHVVSDEWSMQLMVSELVEAYGAFSRGVLPSLQDLPIQYADYAVWQRERLAGEEGERQLSYWQDQLGTEHPVLELPLDRPRPQQLSYQGASLDFSLSASLSSLLQAMAKRHGCTLHMLLLASFQVLLHRYSGQNDIRVGVPIANRTSLETEHLIGFFVNTQVLRVDFHDDLTFADLLSKTKDATIDAQAHQDLPFEQLVDALQPERSLSYSPLFQVMFNFLSEQNNQSGLSLQELDGVTVEAMAWEAQNSLFDLTLDVTECEAGLMASFTYATDLFEHSTIETLATHWQHLLQGIVDDSCQVVQRLSILSEDDAAGLIRTLNPFYPDTPAQQSVQQKFEAKVLAQPDAVAVVLGDEQLTYAELNSRANKLAHRLIEAGIGPDGRVGVSVERSIEMIVGVMAILKAGGAFVPLDPAYPEDRLVHMAHDSGLHVLLTQASVDQGLPFPAAIKRIYLEDPCQSYSDTNPVQRGHDKNLAYMIFTSGTTGLPKGVGIDQGALARHVEVYSERLGLNADDNVLQYATLNFDTFGEQVFPTLCTGGSVIMRGEALWDHDTFYHNLHRYDISVANMTPSMWYQLIKAFDTQGLTDFGRWRRMIVGGEAMPPDALATWQQLGLDKQAQLWNFYGPTEATAASTSYHCAPVFEGDGPLPATVPIGEALKGRGVYIVDRDLNLVPTGVIGELVVGGELLARGYHNRSSLTAERFIADPFSELGGRLYRTGDLARYDQNGTIEYLGRTDHQVKIRGFRVELGEIESQLRAHEQVQDAVVIPHEINGSQQLVAYLIPADSTLVTAEDQHDACFQRLKAHLHSGLPDYMVPVYWIMIEAVPLTPNGKVDRKALPTIESSDFQKEYEAPASALEYQLAEVWQSVLGLERVGRNDNFFELGGDSIVSLQLVSRARQQGLQFTPKDIFQHQTLRGLSTVVVCSDHTIDAEQHMLEGRVDLNPMQSWFFAEGIPESQHWNQSVLLRLHKPVVAQRLEQVISHLLTHHDALRLTFDEYSQGHFGQADVDVLWHRKVADETALTVIANEAQRSLDLKQGPLLRVVLFDFPNGEQRLLWVIHHLVVDGVSWRILLEDFQTIYEQLESHTEVALPAKTSSVRSWSQHLREYGTSDALHNELAYWQNTLTDVRGDLPRDNPTGRQQNQYAQSVASRLDKVLTEQLLKEAPSAYRTQINDLLLTALARVICRWTKESSALIALEGHGREELFDNLDLTRTVGWFTSLFPVKLTPCSDFGSSIKTVKEQLRGVPNKGVGYGILRYLSDGDTRQCLAALPEARITFNYLGQFDSSFDEAQGALFSPAQENSGDPLSEKSPLANWLSINGQVYGGELTLNWSFSGEVYRTDTVQALADEYAQELSQLIAYCVVEDNQGVTPSDFPLTTLSQAQLDGLPVAIGVIGDIYPLSPMQQGMLFHSLNERDEGAYLNQMRVDVRGLDVERFRSAWQATLEQHDILRAGFIWEGVDAPVQVIYNDVTLPMTVYDWRGQSDLSERKDQLAKQRLEQGFVLSKAPLLRLDLVQEESGYHLVYTNHHILMDGWSGAQLFGEVLQRYQGQSPEATLGHYRDYLAWLQRQDDSVSQVFWTRQLSDLEEPTLLTSVIRSELQSDMYENSWADYQCFHSREETERLSEFAKSQKITVNTVLQAAWLLLLQRYTGQNTVTFGATVAGRPTELPGIEQQLGLFINTLPVVGTVESTDSVAEFLSKVQEQNLALREHEHTPLYEIQRWSGQGGSALFDTIMVFENYPISEALQESAPSGLVFGEMSNHEQTNYGLTLSVNLSDELNLECSYDRRQFNDNAIETLMEQLQQLLTQLIDHSSESIQSLITINAQHQEHLLHSYHCSDIPETQMLEEKLPVYTRIATQAELIPEATALIYAEQSLTFNELDQRVDQLAWRLYEQGLKPGALVGLSIGRTIDMVVSLLAILKNGAAYVPLDPEYPEDRLAYMMEDSGIHYLLTEAAYIDRLPRSEQVRVMLIEDDSQSTWNSASFPPVIVHPESLAYLIYTSGSTGKPKGVGVSHRALSDQVNIAINYFDLTSQDRVLLFSSLNFDGFVEQLFPALCVGAGVVIRGNDVWGSETFYQEVQRTGLTVADLSTAYWYMLIQDWAERAKNELPDYGSLRHISASGEAMPPQGISAWQQAGLESVRLMNVYGPTETVVTATCLDCSEYISGQLPLPAAMPIGHGLAGKAMYVLNSHLQPNPIGVVGELFIGGSLLAEGYHKRPGLTAERFIADPFTNEPGARMYATGDLAYYRTDGTIEYAGRTDSQVKIRGFRIELGEIEAKLHALPQIRDAVVVAVADNQQLAAYLIPTETQIWDQGNDTQVMFVSEVKGYLAEHLPEYMLPSQISLLHEMPMSPGGKIDRNALPKMNVFQKSYEAPETVLEQQLIDIWQEILGVERVGRNDNFFELGGHSLLVVRVLAQIRAKVSSELTMHEFMFNPTVKELANNLMGKTNNALNKEPVVKLNSCSSDTKPLFCIHPVSGSVYEYYPLAMRLNEQRPVYGIMSLSYIDAEWVDNDLDELVCRYLTYIKQVQPEGPYYLLGLSVGGLIATLITRKLEEQGDQVVFLGMVDTRRFDKKDRLMIDSKYSASATNSSNVDEVYNSFNIDESVADYLKIIDGMFSSVDFSELVSVYNSLVDQGVNFGLIKNEVIDFIAKKEGASIDCIARVIGDLQFDDEIRNTEQIRHRLSEITDQFSFEAVNVSPTYWFANLSQTALEQKHVREVIQEHIVSSCSADFIHVEENHEKIIGHNDFVETLEKKLSCL